MEKGIYFKLQLKKAMKIYPVILLITIITLTSIVGATAVCLKNSLNSEDKKKVSIGIVGNMEESYLGIGVYALQNMDSSRFSIDFIPMEEAGAIDALKSREISGYVYIPENFIGGILSGENIPAEYVTLNSPDGFGSIIMHEIAKIVSDFITETQTGIRSMHTVARNTQNTEHLSEKTEKLNLKYIEYVLDRNNSYEHKILGISEQLSMGGYYVAGLILFFLLIWGISCNKLLESGNIILSRSLKARGVKIRYQVLCEYGAYLTVTVFTLLVIAIVAGLVLQNINVNIPEINGVGVLNSIGFVMAIIPVIVMITLMQFAIYEIVEGTVGRVLIQFVIAIGIGYISGCFYPNYFFPESIQHIAAILPVGAGFSYLKAIIGGMIGIEDVFITIAYSIIFALLAILIRKRRIAGDLLWKS